MHDTIIIGGGLSGLTVAHLLKQSRPNDKSIILEAGNRTGGAIRSHHDQGYLAEIGPHGFLDNCQESVTILKNTGLDKECVKAPLAKFVRYICLDGKLKLIPQSPKKILAAPLVPITAKIRVLGDFLKKPLTDEPTVSEWIKYRFGSALLPFADAVFTGTYAGDIDRLSIDGVMPGVRELEKTHGSVIKGLFSKLKNKKKGAKSGLPAMTSFPSGMQRLPEKLSESLIINKDLFLEHKVTEIISSDGLWTVITDKKKFTGKNLVLALPINTSLKLLQSLSKESSQLSVPEAKIATIALGFEQSDSDAGLPPGFGYLAPEKENRFCLGALFSSNMFEARVPQNQILLEALVGGRRHPEKLMLDDNKLIANAIKDIKELIDLPEKPVYAKVLRPKGGIPQAEKGFQEILSQRERIIKEHPNLHICGFGWDGIGLNDMMKNSNKVAESIINGMNNDKNTAIKGIYF